jgi:hypothetical protein
MLPPSRLKSFSNASYKIARALTVTASMKFLFLLWIAIGGILNASVWATAAWCVLYSCTSVLWLQCFWIFLAIRFFGHLSFATYIRTHTKEDCFSYMRREATLVGLSIIFAPLISILPTVAAIVLLSLLQVWTNLETHWLHTWLLVTCLVYHLLRAREMRRMGLHPKSKPLQRPRSIWKLRMDPGPRTVAKGVVEQPPCEKSVGSSHSLGKIASSAQKAANGSRSARVIDV